jgi:hypothetical protein
LIVLLSIIFVFTNNKKRKISQLQVGKNVTHGAPGVGYFPTFGTKK